MEDILIAYQQAEGDLKTKIRNELILANQGLVWKEALSTFKRLGCPNWTTLDDLVSQGNQVLIRCLDYYNPSLGFKFSTYIVVSLVRDLRKVYNDFCEVPRNYSYQELQQIRIAYEELNYTGLYAIDTEPMDCLQDLLDNIKLYLTKKEFNVIYLYYVKGFSQRTIAKRYKVSHQRIFQIMQKACEKLKLRLGEKNALCV